MEKKLRFVSDRSKTQIGIMLADGRIISLYDNNNQFYLRFDYKIDLEKGTYDNKVLVDISDSDTMCLNKLMREGAKEVHCYDECIYSEDKYPSQFVITDAKINKIIKFFKDNGYNVTEAAIRHQLYSWKDDYKSGYRDETNGYHLFSPCGCNPLSIRLSTLHRLCEDWQETYFC